MSHLRNNILFYAALVVPIGMIVAFIVTFARVQDNTESTKIAQTQTANDVKDIKAGIVALNNKVERHESMQVWNDSLNRKDRLEEIRRTDLLIKQMSRVEWRLKLPPIELENLPSTDKSKMKPFGDISQRTIETLTEK